MEAWEPAVLAAASRGSQALAVLAWARAWALQAMVLAAELAATGLQAAWEPWPLAA